uniref:LicD family protein n=1 Tax=Pithovirus LCPAC302 TaxID=2506593 RepID=A0A481Z6N9_9VIRU|nr:MAG: LicD family protein [Pithovirus LCPAC302]
MGKIWINTMLEDKYIICDSDYVKSITNVYLFKFLNKCKHSFVDQSTTLKKILQKVEQFKYRSIILFHLSNNTFKQELQQKYTVYDCGNDLNKFSIEMSLMSRRDYIIAHRLCKIVSELLFKYKINYTATGGTKIGILRDNNLLPWDWDIDFVILDTKENILTAEFLKDLHDNNITILDNKPLPKDFKIRFKNYSSLDFYLDMLCTRTKVVSNKNIQKYICHSYPVDISLDHPLEWKEWKEYIKSAYFYCYLVLDYMGQEKYSREGVKIYEELTNHNKFKISEYRNYLNSVFERYEFIL